MSLIIKEVTPKDLHSVAFVTICEGLKKLQKIEFKVNLTTDFCCRKLTEIFDKHLQGTEVIVSTKYGLVKPVTFGQTSMFSCEILKRVGPKKARLLAKNQHNQRKPLYFENIESNSSSKIGHNFRK